MIEISTGKQFFRSLRAISQSLEKLQKAMNADQIGDVINVLKEAFHSEKKVFVYGIGRSLLVGKAFAMRLMHLGFHSYVTSEVVTTAVGENDVFVVISKTLVDDRISVTIEMAKKLRARIIVITSIEEAIPLLKKAEHCLIVPDTSKQIRVSGSYTPLGTLFEISTMVLLDCVVAELMSLLRTTEEEMRTRHANI